MPWYWRWVSKGRESRAQDKVRVAVMNFENNSSWHWWGDNLGYAAQDVLTTALFESGQFSVIERAQIDALLAEQNLGASGRVNAATAAQVGQLLGVQLILTGSITQFSVETIRAGFRGIGGSYSKAESILDVRMINVTTGEIMFAADGEGEKRLGGGYARGANFERDFDAGLAAEAMRPAVDQIVENIMAQTDRFDGLQPVAPPGLVVQTRDDSVYINRGENAGVTVGQQFTVSRVIDEIRDADGTLLDRITGEVGVLEVTRVLSQSAVCRIVSGEAGEGDAIEAR